MIDRNLIPLTQAASASQKHMRQKVDTKRRPTNVCAGHGGDTHGESVVLRHQPHTRRARGTIHATFVQECTVLTSGPLQQTQPAGDTPGARVLECNAKMKLHEGDAQDMQKRSYIQS